MHRFVLRLAVAFLTFVIGIASAASMGVVNNILRYGAPNYFGFKSDASSKVVRPKRVVVESAPRYGRSCLSHREMPRGPVEPARSER